MSLHVSGCHIAVTVTNRCSGKKELRYGEAYENGEETDMTAVARLKSPPRRAANKVLRQSKWLLLKRVLTRFRAPKRLIKELGRRVHRLTARFEHSPPTHGGSGYDPQELSIFEGFRSSGSSIF
jgi:hypothetical protein